MFRKILVGTDGSDTAAVAVGHAAALARATGAQLLIVTAFEREKGRGESPFGAEGDVPPAERARSILAHEEKRVGSGTDVRTVQDEGNPADVILDLAEDEGVDLIVVGNVGMTGTKRFVTGSVPNNITHHAPTNVLIVNTSWATQALAAELDAPRSYESVLLATDGSETAARATEVGASIAEATGAGVVLLHVGDDGRGNEILERAREAIPGNLEVRTMSEPGKPAETILDVAEREGVDLIVVGNKGMTGAKRFLLGSVPNAIAHHAPTNVLIAKTT